MCGNDEWVRGLSVETTRLECHDVETKGLSSICRAPGPTADPSTVNLGPDANISIAATNVDNIHLTAEHHYWFTACSHFSCTGLAEYLN